MKHLVSGEGALDHHEAPCLWWGREGGRWRGERRRGKRRAEDGDGRGGGDGRRDEEEEEEKEERRMRGGVRFDSKSNSPNLKGGE